jgi:branched-chain amino acid transport system substrate-binding protein
MLFVTRNDASGWGSSETETQIWKKMGLQVIGKDFHEPGTKDFTPIVTRVIAQKPELVAMTSTNAGDSALILKLFREMGFKPYIIHTGGFGVLSDTVKICGKEAMEGAISINTDYSSPRAEASVKRFYQKYTTKYKGDWNDTAIWDGEYDQMFVLKAALEKAQSFDHTDLKRVMENPSFRYQSIYGEGRFGGASVYGINHQGIVPVFISIIKGGEAFLVAKELLPPDY